MTASAAITKRPRGILNIFKGIRKKADNLFILAPLPSFPGGDWIPWINKINQKLLAISIKIAAFFLRIKKPILWIFSFTGADLTGKFNEKLSIYYCNDPFAKFAPPGKKRKGIYKIENALIKKVDLVFVVAKTLLEEKIKNDGNPGFRCWLVIFKSASWAWDNLAVMWPQNWYN